MSAPSSAVIRRRQRRWWYYGSSATTDPLGAGNTALIADLGLTQALFHDVRRNLTVAGGTASSLADVKGDGTYGPALVQATGAAQPTWDGTTLNFDGFDWLKSAAALPAWVDLSQPLTVACVLDANTPSAKQLIQFRPTAGGTPYWDPACTQGDTTHGFDTVTNTDIGGAQSALPLINTGLRLLIATVNVGTAGALTLEIPNQGQATHATGAAPGAGTLWESIGASITGTALAPMKFRARLCWPGGYTTQQRDTLKTWAVTYHSAVLA